MSLTRRRSDRPGPALRPAGVAPRGAGEPRSSSRGRIPPFYNPDDLPELGQARQRPRAGHRPPDRDRQPDARRLGNQGKSRLRHGPQRQHLDDHRPRARPGDRHRRHPNDGVLDDNIATIQLIGTNPNTTHVIGQVVASHSTRLARRRSTQPAGRRAERRGALQPAHRPAGRRVDRPQRVHPDADGHARPTAIPNSGTGIFLSGGVRNLSFIGRRSASSTSRSRRRRSTSSSATPTTRSGSSRTSGIDSITNTVFNSTVDDARRRPADDADGRHRSSTARSTASSSARSARRAEPAAEQFFFPIVGSTGPDGGPGHGDRQPRRLGLGDQLHRLATRAAVPEPALGRLAHRHGDLRRQRRRRRRSTSPGRSASLEFAQGLGNPVGLNLAATAARAPRRTATASRQTACSAAWSRRRASARSRRRRPT